MAVCIYDNKAIIPGPLVTIQKSYDRTEGGEPVGTTYVLQLKGKLIPSKGSPLSDGTFWTSSGYPPDSTPTNDQRLEYILRKQGALRKLFSVDGRTLSFVPWSGTGAVSCNPIVKSIEFPEGLWFEYCDYTVTLEADVIRGLTSDEDASLHVYHVSRASDEWSIEPTDETKRTFKVSRTRSASGRRFYDSTGALTGEAWENAKAWVLAGLGLDTGIASAPSILDLSVGYYNYTRAVSQNAKSGTYQVTESWLGFDADGGPAAVTDYTVEVRTDIHERSDVTISGNIRGLEERDNSTYAFQASAWTNALAKWDAFQGSTRGVCESVSGMTLNPIRVQRTVGNNVVAGTISFSDSYSTNPLPLLEHITVTDQHAGDVFAAIPVLGRAVGPVLQGIGTRTLTKRTIAIEIETKSLRYGFTPTKPDTGATVLDNFPGSYLQLFVEQDVESWSATEGRYTRNVVLAFQ